MTEEEKKEMLNKINIEETTKIKLAETLKETVRLAGEFRLNANIFDNDELKKILDKGAKELSEFNKELSTYISTL